jgi:hypothetical protein
MRENPVEVEKLEEPGTGLVEGKDDAAFLGALSERLYVFLSNAQIAGALTKHQLLPQ